MKVFVAGAGGYLGIPLCQQLAKDGYDVIAFDRYFFGKKPEGDRINVVVGDTRHVGFDDFRGVDAVVDLAGLSNDASCDIDASHTKAINVDGATNLVDAALKADIKVYIYSSSASVYGHGEKHNLTEKDALRPLTEYAHSKVIVEGYIRQARSQRYFSPVILRNATVFGMSPRMRFDLAVNAMAARALLEGTIYCMGGGNQWRPFIHVDDVVSSIIWSINHAHDAGVTGETFNVGCQANQMTIRTLAGKIGYTFPGVKIHMIPDDPDARSYHLSFDKMRKLRPGQNFRTIEDGVWEIRGALTQGKVSFTDPTTHTLNWYKQILEWNQRLEEFRSGGPIL
jgi:nucleoside-diphosphate-sugar epimerase